MTRNPIIVSETTSISQIEEIFSKNKIWTLYVGNTERYIGVLTRKDLKIRGRNKKKSTPAFEIMSKRVFSIDVDADVEDAKRLLIEKNINGLAVTRNGKPCGIITWYDIENKSPPPPNNLFPTHGDEETPRNVESIQQFTWIQRTIKYITTNPNDRKIQKKLEKIKNAKIKVTKKIDDVFENEIQKINEDLQILYDNGRKALSIQEEIFFAKKIKNLQQIRNSKWEILDKLLMIQHYYERILAVGDINSVLKDFGLQEFNVKELEDFVIGIKIDEESLNETGNLIDVITSPTKKPAEGEEDLKEILDEIRSKKLNNGI